MLGMIGLPQWFSGSSHAGRIFNTLRGDYWFVVSIAMAVMAKALRIFRRSRFSGRNNYRMPSNSDETRYWISNMLKGHGFSIREVSLATGLEVSELPSLIERYRPSDVLSPIAKKNRTLSILPYPGGRHPRRGFQDGALFPQRETKVSIFAPWNPTSYVVADVPEAIFSNRGLIYLAHTHVATLWDKRGIRLEPLEWRRHSPASLSIRRRLPDGIAFGVRVKAYARSVAFRLWLLDRSPGPLTRLRVQNCVLLGRLAGFDTQTNRNKIFRPPYAACRSIQGNRWIIVGSEPCYRVWANPLCPCIHSDAKFPDCRPGEPSEITIRIWFYVGTDIYQKFKRLDASGWWRT
jgi:hypothetical protein